MGKVKKKALKKKATKRRKISARKTYEKGKRIEAYTMGEALGSKKWP